MLSEQKLAALIVRLFEVLSALRYIVCGVANARLIGFYTTLYA